MSESLGKPNIHIHNPEAEGVLPDGFSTEGRSGKVRNVYLSTDPETDPRICLIATNRVSAFDVVSPTLIPGKGELLNDIARRELEAAQQAGIPVWFDHVPDYNPNASIGTLTDVLPVEMIYRNYMTGSMWREYRDTGDFADFRLASGMSEWHSFADNPLFTPSTKSDIEDESFNPAQVQEKTGIDPKIFEEMEDLGRRLFELGTQRAAQRGLILVDTKYEMGIAPDGQIIIIDEVHTPDSSRFVIADGFEQTVADGERPNQLSKEFLREAVMELANNDKEEAKKIMRTPLPPEIVEGVQQQYRQLHGLFAQ